jgi:hypothetical protein
MDTPIWYYWLIYKSPGFNSMKYGILEFSGIKPVKIKSFTPLRTSNEKIRKAWLSETEELGKLQGR